MSVENSQVPLEKVTNANTYEKDNIPTLEERRRKMTDEKLRAKNPTWVANYLADRVEYL